MTTKTATATKTHLMTVTTRALEAPRSARGFLTVYVAHCATCGLDTPSNLTAQMARDAARMWHQKMTGHEYVQVLP